MLRGFLNALFGRARPPDTLLGAKLGPDAATRNQGGPVVAARGQGRVSLARGKDPWFDIVGEASYQATLQRIAGKRLLGRQGPSEGDAVSVTCLIVPEPSNPHDRNAIRVDAEGFGTVGYFKREDAAGYFKLIAEWLAQQGAIGVCPGELTGGWSTDAHIGVRLDIQSPYHLRAGGIGPPLESRGPQLAGCGVPEWHTRTRVRLPSGKPRPISDEYPFQGTIRAIVGARDPATETVAFEALLVPDPTNAAGSGTVVVCAEGLGPVGRLGSTDARKLAEQFAALTQRQAVASCDGWVVLEGTRLGVKIHLCSPGEFVQALTATPSP